MSYTRNKDELCVVSNLHSRVSNELSLLDPDGTIFRDRKGLLPGDDFRKKLAQELHSADVLVVLLSPAWLASEWCRWEYSQFTAKESAAGRTPRILPLLWVKTKAREGDALSAEVCALEYDDWTTLRHKPVSDPEVSARCASVAERLEELASGT